MDTEKSNNERYLYEPITKQIERSNREIWNSNRHVNKEDELNHLIYLTIMGEI